MSSNLNEASNPCGLTLTVSAPGKLILFGEHSVVYGKTALAASINRRTCLKLHETNNNVFTIKMTKINIDCSFPFDSIVSILDSDIPLKGEKTRDQILPDDIDHDVFVNSTTDQVNKLINIEKLSKEQNTSLIVFFYLLHSVFYKEPNRLKTLTVEIDSALTLGAGTGSSASYCVCIAAALTQYKKRSIHGDGHVSLSELDRQQINRWAYLGERIIHGRPSGLDNTACTYGAFVEMNRSSPLADGTKCINVLKNPPQIHLILINTAVPRNTSKLVQHVAALKARNPISIELILNAMDEISKNASDLLNKIGCAQTQLLPFVEEFRSLEELIDMNQGLLYSLGVSHRRLQEICMLCAGHGLHAKLTGAGGGGFAFTIVPSNFDCNKLSSCLTELENLGYETLDVVLGDEGVQVNFI